MSDLDAIRAARLAQLQSQSGSSSSAAPPFQLPPGMRPSGPNGGGGGPAGPGGQDGPSREEQEKKAEQEDEVRRGIIAQVLETDARERLSRISLTRPSLSRQIEDLLVRMARSGQLRGKVGDEELKGLLDRVSAQSQPKTTVPQNSRTKNIGAGITIQRKRADSDSDEYDL